MSDAVSHRSFVYRAQVRSEAAYGRKGWTKRGTYALYKKKTKETKKTPNKERDTSSEWHETEAFKMNFMRLCLRDIFMINYETDKWAIDVQEMVFYLNIAATVSQLATSLVSWVGVNPMIAGPCDCSADTKPFDRSSKLDYPVEIPACEAAYDRARAVRKWGWWCSTTEGYRPETILLKCEGWSWHPSWE